MFESGFDCADLGLGLSLITAPTTVGKQSCDEQIEIFNDVLDVCAAGAGDAEEAVCTDEIGINDAISFDDNDECKKYAALANGKVTGSAIGCFGTMLMVPGDVSVCGAVVTEINSILEDFIAARIAGSNPTDCN